MEVHEMFLEKNIVFFFSRNFHEFLKGYEEFPKKFIDKFLEHASRFTGRLHEENSYVIRGRFCKWKEVIFGKRFI